MTALRLALVPLLVAVPSVAGSACAPSPGASGAQADPAHADVIFQGSATDPALSAMLAATPADDPALATYFDNPTDLSEIPAAPVITFTWHDGQQGAMRLLPAPAQHKVRTFTGVLADLLGEGTAYAGTPTMSGTGYLLAFRTLDTNEALFRVFTSTTSYTPDQAAWGKLATGTWSTLQITSAVFAGDQIASGTTPIHGQLIKFCIGAWK